MKIAILGGSFNPLHIGHAMLADTVLKELGYDKIFFVPTCIPPHKEIHGGATTAQRLELVTEFCKSETHNHFEVESCEIERGGVSYTIDTVRYITEKYKNELEGKIALLMGEEIAAEFDKWRDPDKIVELCDLIIVPRYPDYFGQKISEMKNTPIGNYCGDFKKKFKRETFKYPCKVLDIPLIPVSSTEIRGRIASGLSFKYLVPPAVFNYIEEHNLYR